MPEGSHSRNSRFKNCSNTLRFVCLVCFSFQACQLPLFSYIVERLCACCYEQAWYAKLGGVVSIKFLMERLPLTWVLQNQQTFLKALLFVMMDLTGEVGDGGSNPNQVVSGS